MSYFYRFITNNDSVRNKMVIDSLKLNIDSSKTVFQLINNMDKTLLQGMENCPTNFVTTYIFGLINSDEDLELNHQIKKEILDNAEKFVFFTTKSTTSVFDNYCASLIKVRK